MRNNQRNSRARRQAYVKELEGKWANCVQTGARANLEMQQAARRVVAENVLLRQLLNEQGLNDEAIQSRIKQAGKDHSSPSEGRDSSASSPSDGWSRFIVPDVSLLLLRLFSIMFVEDGWIPLLYYDCIHCYCPTVSLNDHIPAAMFDAHLHPIDDSNAGSKRSDRKPIDGIIAA